jgi:hypothetical protein
MRGVLKVALVLAVAGCTDDPIGVVTPGEGAMSGYIGVRIDVERADAPPDSVSEVRFGDQIALDLEPLGPDAFEVLIQGAPTAGPVDVTIQTDHELLTIPEGFQFGPTPSNHFLRMVAVGASLSQGVQNGVPNFRGGLMSPPAQIARQLGGFFPLPLLVRDFLPPITPADIGPPPACLPPDIVAHVTQSALEALEVLSEGYDAARMDPDISIGNLAVGGSKVKTVLEGPAEDDLVGNFVSRLVLEPYTIGPVERSQLEHAEDRQPTLVVSADLYGNDAAASLLQGDVIDPSFITPMNDFEADLTEVIDRLAATGAMVFLANMPRPSLLPLTATKRKRMIQKAVDEAMEAGVDPLAAAEEAALEADAAIAETDSRAEEMNALLAELADEHINVHVVDLAAEVDEVAESGISAGGQQLSTRKFGGLLSLDGVHFTDTGYAMVANVFLERINGELGTDVPLIDLDRVVDDDPGSPKALALAGLDVSLCE